MTSRNQLLGEMRRPQTPEERLNELNCLRGGVPYLTPQQQNRLEELEAWNAAYQEEMNPFRHWVFHPAKGEKVAESRKEFERCLSEGWYATRDELKEAINTATAEGRQKQIEQEFKEEIVEEKKIDKHDYLIFLKRALIKDSGTKMLYYYTTEELREAYNELDLEYEDSMSRIELYKQLKTHIELHV